MRGGTAHCTVIVSEEPIGSPLVRNPDVGLALNLPSVDKYEDLLPAFERAAKSTKPAIVDIVIEEQPPLPDKITYEQAASYSKYMLKKAFEEQEIDMPPLKKALKRIF